MFRFPEEYLEKADAGTVENAIGQVFSIGNDTQAQSNQPQGQQEQAQPGQARQEQRAEQEQVQPPIRRRFSGDRARMKYTQRWASRKRL